MIVQTFGKNVPIVLFKGIIDQEKISSMLAEIESFIEKDLLLDPRKTASAQSEYSEYKNNVGLFVENQYVDRNKSSILRSHININKILLDELDNKHILFEYFFHTTWYSTLLSVYTNGSSYFEHNDHSVITTITYLWNQPKSFNGGEIFFREYNLTVDVDLGDVIVFPGFIKHGVNEVYMDNPDPRYGRFAISQFFIIK